jgi:hypothetical protein
MYTEPYVPERSLLLLRKPFFCHLAVRNPGFQPKVPLMRRSESRAAVPAIYAMSPF